MFYLYWQVKYHICREITYLGLGKGSQEVDRINTFLPIAFDFMHKAIK